MGLGLALWVQYLEDPILIRSKKSAELYNIRYTEATREHRMRIAALWGGMGVTLSVIWNLENRALRWYSHVERRKEERLPKNMMCWPSVVEEGDVHLNGKYIALVSCGRLGAGGTDWVLWKLKAKSREGINRRIRRRFLFSRKRITRPLQSVGCLWKPSYSEYKTNVTYINCVGEMLCYLLLLNQLVHVITSGL